MSRAPAKGEARGVPSSGRKAPQGVAEDPARRPVGGNPTMTVSRQRARGGDRRTGPGRIPADLPGSAQNGPGRDAQAGH
ncbi:hypothetical protein EYE35_03590 [Cereibacter sphaeroides]|nr:hypothetical protein EYE35_03590 [Cereibacter sphaeroides]